MSTRTKPRPAAGEFRGVLAGVIYTDRALFEETAKAMQLTSKPEQRADWRPGIEVSLRLYGSAEPVRGQVWARCPQRGYVCTALDGGRFVALNTRYGGVYEQPGNSNDIGRVWAA